MSHRVNQGVLTSRDAKQVRRSDGEEEGEEEEEGRLGKIMADKLRNGRRHGIYGGWDEIKWCSGLAPPILPYVTNAWYGSGSKQIDTAVRFFFFLFFLFFFPPTATEMRNE